MDREELRAEVDALSEWGGFEQMEALRAILAAMLDRIEALEDAPPAYTPERRF